MDTKKPNLVEINPYNEEHLHKIEEFESKMEYKLPIAVSQIIRREIEGKTERQYQVEQQLSDAIQKNFYLEVDGKFVSSCYLDGQKSEGICALDVMTLPEYKNQGYTSNVLSLVSDYALRLPEVHTVMLTVNKNNKSSLKAALLNGFNATDEMDNDLVIMTKSKENVRSHEK